MASSLVTARVTSRVRPCRTSDCASDDEGSGVSIDGKVKGFFIGTFNDGGIISGCVEEGKSELTYVNPGLPAQQLALVNCLVRIFFVPEAGKSSAS